MVSNMESQLAAALGQFKKMSSTWTNHLSPGPLPDTYVDICNLFRGAFLRQSLLSGIATFEHTHTQAIDDKNLVEGYRVLFSSQNTTVFFHEFAVVISSDYFGCTCVIGNAEQVQLWREKLKESGE